MTNPHLLWVPDYRIGPRLGLALAWNDLEADVADHLFRIVTGYHGGETPPSARAGERPTASVRTKTLYVPSAPAGSCCCP